MQLLLDWTDQTYYNISLTNSYQKIVQYIRDYMVVPILIEEKWKINRKIKWDGLQKLHMAQDTY